MTQQSTASNIQRTENLFHNYPDIPPEIVVKQDLLRLGEGFSDSALDVASAAEKKSYRKFSMDLVPMSSMKRQEYLKAPENFFIKGGIYKLRPVAVQTKLAADSPYLVDVIDGRLKLLLDGVAIADVGYRTPLKYYTKSFPDGTSYGDIVGGGYSIAPFRLCQFWGIQEECKFCDINENARQVKKFKADTLSAPVMTVEQVATVANEIAKEVSERDGYPAPIRFAISSGTITSRLHGIEEDEFYLRYVEAIKWAGPRRYVTLATNAKDKETLKGHRSRGVDHCHPNLEVWDKRLFEWICPGKAKRVGWEQWVRRLVEAVDVFGEGNVASTFVCGMEMAQPYGFNTVDEAVKSTTEGIKFLMSHGVHPRFTPWVREPGSYLQKKYDQPAIPPEFYLQLLRNYYENHKRYGLSVPHRISCYLDQRVMGTGFSFFDDYLIITEQKDYRRLALQALEKGGAIWSCSSKDAAM
ncbi:MAG: radical SAM protein [Chloroflexi bacterium]|nr:radical SAM protein [Chloroflexota bacterium]